MHFFKGFQQQRQVWCDGEMLRQNTPSISPADHKSIAVIKSDIYRHLAMVTVDVFLVSLFVGAQCVCIFISTHV